MREFRTAVQTKLNETPEGAITFPIIEVDADDNETGRQIVTVYPPEPAQVAVAMSGVGRHMDPATKVATIIDFFYEVLDSDSAAYIRRRLLSREDPFGLKEVGDILHDLMEEWSGRPTQESQDSSSSPSSTGPSSTPRTSEPTSSDLAWTGSLT